MNCLVIDDEPLARKGMQMLIEQMPGLELSAMFSNAVEAGTYLSKNPVDLVFLDIQMPLMNGLDFIRAGKNLPKIIITTAYPQFAVDAFELEVVDYLVKPIRFERFYKAVSRASASLPPIDQEEDDDYIFIRSDRKFIRTYYAEIDCIEGLKDYAIVHCGKEKYPVASNLKSIYESLPSSYFLRVSKSWIVNMSKVTAIEHDSVQINNRQIPVGDNFRKQVMDFVRLRKIIQR